MKQEKLNTLLFSQVWQAHILPEFFFLNETDGWKLLHPTRRQLQVGSSIGSGFLRQQP